MKSLLLRCFVCFGIILAIFYIILFNQTSSFSINDLITINYPSNIKIIDIISPNSKSEFIDVFNSYDTYKKYKCKNEQLTFEYPDVLQLSEIKMSGGEILCHVNILNKKTQSYGFVQVWSTNQDLKDFLDKSLSTSSLNYKTFSSQSIVINSLKGYLWKYSLSTPEKTSIQGQEVFLIKHKKIYRLSYFNKKKSWDKNDIDTFWNIVKSFKIL